MSEGDLSVLLGIHHPSMLEQYRGLCQDMWYNVDEAITPETMLEKVASREYDRYVMDLNLGVPNSTDITAAIQVYDIVRSRVESGRAKFMGISGNRQAVIAAKELGIPAEYRLDFKLVDFFKL